MITTSIAKKLIFNLASERLTHHIWAAKINCQDNKMNKAIKYFYSKLIFLKIKNTKIYLYIKINFKKLAV